MPYLLYVDREKMKCPSCESTPTSEDVLRKAAPKILDLAFKMEMMSEYLQELTCTLAHLKRFKSNLDLQRSTHTGMTVTIIGGSISVNGVHEKKENGGVPQQLPREFPAHTGCNVENIRTRMFVRNGFTLITPLNRTKAAERVVPAPDPIIQPEVVETEPKDAKEEGDANDAAAVNKGE